MKSLKLLFLMICLFAPSVSEAYPNECLSWDRYGNCRARDPIPVYQCGYYDCRDDGYRHRGGWRRYQPPPREVWVCENVFVGYTYRGWPIFKNHCFLERVRGW